MPHCVCSSNSLNVFIRSIAGLELRQLQHSGSHSIRRSINALNCPQQQRSYSVIYRRNYSAQAESSRDGFASSTDANMSADTAAGAGSSHSTSQAVVDEKNEQDEKTSVGQSDQNSSQAVPTRSRQENRSARKARRVAAGTFYPQRVARVAAVKEERAAKRAAIKAAVKSIRNEQITESRAERGSKSGSLPSVANLGVDETEDSSKRRARKTGRKHESGRASNVTESGEAMEDTAKAAQTKPKTRTRQPTTSNHEDSIVQSILMEVEQGKPPKPPRKTQADKKASGAKSATAELQGDLEDGTFAQPKKPEKPAWAVQKEALKEKLGGAAWNPRKRLSPDSLNGIRALHESDPKIFTTPVLAQHFKITPDAIRRILKSNFRPNEKEIEDRRHRWEKRGIDRRAGIEAQKTRSRTAHYIKDILNPIRV